MTPINLTDSSTRFADLSRLDFISTSLDLASLLLMHERETRGGTPPLPRDPLWRAALEYRLTPSERTRRQLLEAARDAAQDDRRLEANYGCPLYRAAVSMYAAEASASRMARFARLAAKIPEVAA